MIINTKNNITGRFNRPDRKTLDHETRQQYNAVIALRRLLASAYSRNKELRLTPAA